MDPKAQPDLTAVLASAYGLPGAVLERLPVGQVTVNYRAHVGNGDQVLFVKHYQGSESNLGAEQDAVDQTQLAGIHQVPVASVRPSVDGDTVVRQDGIAVSVWEWVPGTVVEDGLNPAQQRAAGTTLGRIHTAFADHPAGSGPSAKLEKWLRPDIDKLEATAVKLLGIAGERAQRDAFDEQALRTLAERRAVLHRIPELLDGLPPLTTQVLHGDYSAVNLLFQGDELTAVLDFCPRPVPGRLRAGPDRVRPAHGRPRRGLDRGGREPGRRLPGDQPARAGRRRHRLRPGCAAAADDQFVRGQAALPQARPPPGGPGPVLAPAARRGSATAGGPRRGRERPCTSSTSPLTGRLRAVHK